MMNDIQIYQKLKTIKSYTPNEEVNQIFSLLVSYALDKNNSINLNEGQLQDLQKICSQAEEQLELDYVGQILLNDATLESFQYYNNYEEQIKLEIEALKNLEPNIKKVLFVGGGPLPLSAILMARKYGLACDIIEKNKEYATLSERLLVKLGLQNIKVINTEALDYGGYADYDLVVISALTQSDVLSKESLINKISSLANLLSARYATRNHILLYPDLNKSIINNIAFIVDPTGNIINSSLIIKN